MTDLTVVFVRLRLRLSCREFLNSCGFQAQTIIMEVAANNSATVAELVLNVLDDELINDENMATTHLLFRERRTIKNFRYFLRVSVIAKYYRIL